MQVEAAAAEAEEERRRAAETLSLTLALTETEAAEAKSEARVRLETFPGAAPWPGGPVRLETAILQEREAARREAAEIRRSEEAREVAKVDLQPWFDLRPPAEANPNSSRVRKAKRIEEARS